MPRPRKPPPKAPRRKRRTGSISVSADGTIRARPPATIDKRRTAREFRPGEMAQAVAYLDALLAPPEPEAAPSKTVEVWAGEWWETYIEGVRVPNTAATYLSHLRHLAPVYAALLPALKTIELQAIVRNLTGELAPATVESIVGVWRRCFDAAVEDGLIARNPAKRLTVPDVPPKPPARHVTADEVAALWPAIRGRRFEIAFALMLGCGLRIGEILGLYREHVDLVNRRAWIQHQFTNGHWRDLPKAKNPHWIPLPERVAGIMARHLASLPDEYVLVMQAPYQGRLAKRDGRVRPWSRRTVADALDAVIAELGLEKATPHAGRHGLASHLMEGGISPPVIAERLGNTPSMILNTYGHATPEGRDRAGKMIEAYLSGDGVSGTQDEAEGDVGAA